MDQRRVLGASALIFVEPDSTVYLEGEEVSLYAFGCCLDSGLVKQMANCCARVLRRIHLLRLTSNTGWTGASFRLEYHGDDSNYDPLLKEDVVVLEGYYDAMSVVPSLTPGAERAASATALLGLARYFRENPPARTVVFLATSAHHLGLRGVDDFIQRACAKKIPLSITCWCGAWLMRHSRGI